MPVVGSGADGGRKDVDKDVKKCGCEGYRNKYGRRRRKRRKS